MKYTPFDLSAQTLGLSFYFDDGKVAEIQGLSDDALYRLVAHSFDASLSLHSSSITRAIDAGVFNPIWLLDTPNLVPTKVECIGHSFDHNLLRVDLALAFPPISLREDISGVEDLNEHCDGWVTDLLDSVAMNEFGLRAFGSYEEVGIDQKFIYLDKGE